MVTTKSSPLSLPLNLCIDCLSHFFHYIFAGERQKILDDHATRIRELEAAHNAAKFDADKHVGELKAQVSGTS